MMLDPPSGENKGGEIGAVEGSPSGPSPGVPGMPRADGAPNPALTPMQTLVCSPYQCYCQPQASLDYPYPAMVPFYSGAYRLPPVQPIDPTRPQTLTQGMQSPYNLPILPGYAVEPLIAIPQGSHAQQQGVAKPVPVPQHPGTQTPTDPPAQVPGSANSSHLSFTHLPVEEHDTTPHEAVENIHPAPNLCRDYIRGSCTRPTCKFYHPTPLELVIFIWYYYDKVCALNSGRTELCRDYLNGRCTRGFCRFVHPPAFLLSYLRENGGVPPDFFDLAALRKENAELRTELNRLRKRCHMQSDMTPTGTELPDSDGDESSSLRTIAHAPKIHARICPPTNG